MKSPLIVLALCAVFLSLATGAKPQPPTRFVLNAHADAPGAAAAQPPVPRKAKAAKLPRWHRVIPGMFR